MAKAKSAASAKQHQNHLVVYPGSFDPFTWGHMEVINRALKMFDSVIVAVGSSATKEAMFSTNDRVQMIKDACKGLARLEVVPYDGLSVTFAKSVGAVALIRGLRSEADFTYEMPMALANRELAKDLQTLFIPTDPKYCYISSSLVKEIARLGGDVSSMVPPTVSKKLSDKLLVRK